MNVAKWLLLALLALPIAGIGGVHRGGRAHRLSVGAGAAAGDLAWPAAWCCAMPAATTSPASASPWGQGGFTALQADSAGTIDPACRDSPADSRVYNGCRWAFCCCWRRCDGRSARCLGSSPRQRAPTAWSISSPSNGTRCPIPLCRTGATTSTATTVASLFPSRRRVSQPPRSIIRSRRQGVLMSTTNGGPAPSSELPPQLNVVAQYIKDFSFENPNAPQSLQRSGSDRRRSPFRSTSMPSRCRKPTSRWCSSSTARRKTTAA